MSLELELGEKVALVGANGAGKSTTLRGVFCLANRIAGAVYVEGHQVVPRPQALVDVGVAYVPEGRHVFGQLTVEENLAVAALASPRTRSRVGEVLERVFDSSELLASMRNRRAGALSGGQQQLLAIWRALSQEPRYLLVDEPSLGLSPVAVDSVYEQLDHLVSRGVALLLVEQNVELALSLCSRAYVLQAGEIAASGQTSDLANTALVRELYFGAA
ncbi:ABC transporter ATP-binding protein [Nocardioides sp. AN3]